MSYREISQKNVSEKVSLAWIEPSQRLSAAWSLHSGAVYVADVAYWVIGVVVNSAELDQASSIDTLVEGSFYFDPSAKKLYVWLVDDQDPKFEWTQVIYRMFFSDKPISLPFDLENGLEVPYEPLIASISQGGARFDPEEPSIAVEGSGGITLHNDSGFFQPIFGRLTWQSQGIRLFSMLQNREDHYFIRIFDGQVTSQNYSAQQVSFSAKDFVYKLRSQMDLPLFSEEDGRIPDSLIGKPKRRLYGRVRGLKSESIDRQLTSYPAKVLADDLRSETNITASLTTDSNLVGASNSDIAEEICTGDRVEIGGSDYRVATVCRIQAGLDSEQETTFDKVGGSNPNVTVSFPDIDTSLVTTADHVAIGLLTEASASLRSRLRGVWPIVSTTSSTITFATDSNTGFTSETFKASIGEISIVKGGDIDGFYISEESPTTEGALQINVKPVVPYRRLNRDHLIAGHACHEVNVEVEAVRSSTSFVVSDVSNLRIGDLITFDGTKLNTIESILPGTRDIRVQDGVNPIPQPMEPIKRLAVQKVAFRAATFVPLRDYTVTNGEGGASLTFSNRAEEAVTPRSNAGLVVWTNGARAVVSLGGAFTGLKARDWVRVANESDWYEIDEIIRGDIAILKQPYAGTSGAKATVVKSPTYIDDKSSIFIDTYGITDDGTPDGSLVATAADACLHALKEAGIANIDEASFAQGSIDAPYLLSVAVPRQANLAPLAYRGLLNRFNSSVLSTIFVGPDYNLKYTTLSAARLESDAIQLTDFDVINDSISSDSNNIIGKVVANYRFQDISETSDEPTNQTTVIESEFVANSGIEGQGKTVELFLFDEQDASTIASRLMFMTELPKSEVTLEGNVDLNNLFLNDLVVYRAARLFERYGSPDSARVGIVTSIRKGPLRTTLVVSDLGNIFSRVGVICPNDTPDYDPNNPSNFTSYITDNHGTLGDDESLGSNLIG
ncbi:MAG: hypothetical protein ACOH5I_21835 [Oligoflexus sp.]